MVTTKSAFFEKLFSTMALDAVGAIQELWLHSSELSLDSMGYAKLEVANLLSARNDCYRNVRSCFAVCSEILMADMKAWSILHESARVSQSFMANLLVWQEVQNGK